MSLFSQTLVNQLVGFGQTAVRVAAQPAGPPLPHISGARGAPPARPPGGRGGAPACTPCAAAKMVRDARKKFGR